MCNAWNHSACCNCGWGGVNHTYSYSGNTAFNTRRNDSLKNNKNSTNFDNNESKTYQAKCFWCNELVFHHTNGNGDYVMFDSLGYPWQVHQCWYEHWEYEKKRKRILNKIFNTLTKIEMKYLIIKSIAASIPNVLVNEFNIYGAKEQAVANKMNYSIEDLRKNYGDVYDVSHFGYIKLKKIEKVICRNCGERVDKNIIRQHCRETCTNKKFYWRSP